MYNLLSSIQQYFSRKSENCGKNAPFSTIFTASSEPSPQSTITLHTPSRLSPRMALRDSRRRNTQRPRPLASHMSQRPRHKKIPLQHSCSLIHHLSQVIRDHSLCSHHARVLFSRVDSISRRLQSENAPRFSRPHLAAVLASAWKMMPTCSKMTTNDGPGCSSSPDFASFDIVFRDVSYSVRSGLFTKGEMRWNRNAKTVSEKLDGLGSHFLQKGEGGGSCAMNEDTWILF